MKATSEIKEIKNKKWWAICRKTKHPDCKQWD